MTDEELVRFFAYGSSGDRLPPYEGIPEPPLRLREMLRRLEGLGVLRPLSPTDAVTDVVAEARAACRTYLEAGEGG